MLDVKRVTLILALLFSVAACGRANFDVETASSVAVRSELPVPTAADLVQGQRTMVIGPGDVLKIDILGAEDLSRVVTVDSSGSIQYPLIGNVDVLGATEAQIGTRIADGLRGRYVRDPQVSVRVTEAVSQRVTVGGAVKNPGVYPVLGDTTLSQSIARGGGLTEYARTDEVVVFRTVSGQRYAARFDIADIYGGRSIDPVLQPNDQVVVGSDRNRALLRDIAPLTPILGLFYQII
jgi:polysaccharide biosynthesis/export protein